MEIAIKAFAYNNPSGGTNFSKGPFDVEFVGEAVVTLHSGFWDYETGWRLRGVPVSEELKSFISEHGHPIDNLVYFSEFDLVADTQREDVIKLATAIERDTFKTYLERVKEAVQAQPANTAAIFAGSVAVVHYDNVFFCALDSDQKPEYGSLVDPDISAWCQEWKNEMDGWFQSPKFEPYTEDDRVRMEAQLL